MEFIFFILKMVIGSRIVYMHILGPIKGTPIKSNVYHILECFNPRRENQQLPKR